MGDNINISIAEVSLIKCKINYGNRKYDLTNTNMKIVSENAMDAKIS